MRTSEAIDADTRAVFDSFPNQQCEVHSVLAERNGEMQTG